MKKIILLSLSVFLCGGAVLNTGCSNSKNYASDKVSRQDTGETSKLESERIVSNYWKAISDKNGEDAYKMLDPNNRPDKDKFVESVKRSNISQVKINQSEKINDQSFKVFIDFTDGKKEFEKVPFTTVLNGGSWFVRINTDPDKGETLTPKR
ncbi:hypothetical protein WMW72_16260 [Paenibacillus filicis]|uniref:Lipoprotein n=1 Tax=Paenibacillus filicis TaxID=669464 RepID=A0ABU9DKT1_9BACL